jgi:parvulin-like peptidyl-prolyl isomerase
MKVIEASHILVKSEALAEDLHKQIIDGADFAELAAKYSVCPSKEDGGKLGEFSPGSMVKAFDNAAFELAPDQLSGIVQTKYGFHIIKRHA